MQSCRVAKASILAAVTLLLIGAAPEASAQDETNLRSGGRKLDLSELRAQPETNHVVVKFREGEKVRLTDQKLSGMRGGQANLLNNVLRQAGVTRRRSSRYSPRRPRSWSATRPTASAAPGASSPISASISC